MNQRFQYRPRFIDIRVKPPTEEPKPEEQVCEWEGCCAPGACKAPKGPKRPREFYWFCPAHTAEYNRKWDYYADLTDEEIAADQSSTLYGDRPTWRMGGQLRRNRAYGSPGEGVVDPFGLFGVKGVRPRAVNPNGKERRRLGKLEERAFDTLGVDHEADAPSVRRKYSELVKAYHPDANGGDRSSEQRLTEVIRAFKTLKKAGYA
jgi:hypothetical protein